MPFIPFVLLLAWQALSKSASFALGWATASFFGQIPGNRGRILSIMGLISVAWVIAGVGAFIPLALGIAAQETRVIGPQSVEIEVWHLVAITVGLILAPAVVTAFAEFGFEREGSIGRWLGRIPLSYPVTASLGISVLQMVVITPIVSLRRWRRHHTTLNIPLVVHDGHFDELTDALSQVLAKLGHEAHREELTGPVSWPSRTMGLAVRELLGSVVRGDPVRIRGGEIELALHATNVSVVGPKEDAHVVRSAIEKELAFSPAFLTWSEPSQELEAQLKELYEASDGSGAELTRRLDELQEKIDAADLKLEEWNVLYRLRLQMERDGRKGKGGSRADDSRPERVAVAAGG